MLDSPEVRQTRVHDYLTISIGCKYDTRVQRSNKASRLSSRVSKCRQARIKGGGQGGSIHRNHVYKDLIVFSA
jgi:hypothetical protein